MFQRLLPLALLLGALCLTAGFAASRPVPAAMQVVDLRCEYLKDPLGIDTPSPRLSWRLRSEARGQVQRAYRILVASSPERLKPGLTDLWDAGRVASAESIQIPYGGKALASGQRCWWTVQAWDGEDRPTAWSRPAWWETGLLRASDWKAAWIGASASAEPDDAPGGAAPLLRKEFTLPGMVRSARAYVCGLGYFELRLNGEKVGGDVLVPNQTEYDRRNLRHLLYPFDDRTRKRVLYLTYDVTRLLRQGPNALGAMLGNGWYNQRERRVEGWMWYDTPRLILQLDLTMADGSRRRVVTDESWKVGSGPITANCIFVGESYDARQEKPGWDRASYDDYGWRSARRVRAPQGPLEAQMGPPDRVTATLRPAGTTQPKPGVYHYDFGQNLAGWVRLRVRGPRGRTLTLRFSEELGPDYGQVDQYTLKGDGVETWEPRFTWHGFRTVEVSGCAAPVQLVSVEARSVHSAVEPVGRFTCSDPLLNGIQENYVRAQLANMHGGVTSDCPHRERLGYTGDGQIAAEAAIYNLDMPAFYTKWIRDIGDAQNAKTGFVPHTAPFEGGGGGPPWGSAYVLMPWYLYQYYGDRRVLAEHYAGMKHWIEYLGTRADADHIVTREEPGGWFLGDWATPEKVEIPPEFVSTCYYARLALLMARVAGVLDRPADSREFKRLGGEVAAGLTRRYFNPATGHYSIGRQGADALPLAFRLVPEQYRGAVAANVVRNVEEHGGHLDTGIMGTPALLEALAENGHTSVAYRLLTQRTPPGYGAEIEKGATTLWESWDGGGSHNHPMYGSVSAWFYRYLAGIQPDTTAPGFRRIVIRPAPVAGLTSASGECQSPYGRIASRWIRSDGTFRLNVSIPANTGATVFLPGTAERTSESGTPLAHARGVQILRREAGGVVVRIGSGSYSFICVGG